MEGEVVVEDQTGSASGIRSLFSTFKSLKDRARSSLLCSSTPVVPINEFDRGEDADDEEDDDAVPSNGSEEATETIVENTRAYGVANLRVAELEEAGYDEEEEVEGEVDDDDQGEESSDLDAEKDEDVLWEENMYRKMYEMRRGKRPVEFRLYLVEMIRYTANIDDLKSISVYIRQLQTEYGVYDNYEKIIRDQRKPRARTKFRVDRVAEELIVRLATLQIGSAVDWKRTVTMICDRLKSNMEPKPKVDMKELPKIFTRGKSATAKDVRDAWVVFTTIDLTGYALQGSREGVRLRRRLTIYLSMRPIMLVKLNLDHTGLDKERFLPMLAYIAALPSLQELDLRGNRLNSAIIKYFYPYLGTFGDRFRFGFPRLRWVYFNHNVDIHRLPTKFIVCIDRRWPPVEHRPTPRELSDCRAAVSDFSQIDRIREKIVAKRKQIEKRTRLIRKGFVLERRRRQERKKEILRSLAETNGNISSDSSTALSSASETNTTGHPAAAADDGAVDAANDANDDPPTRSSALSIAQVPNQNDNSNNAEGNEISDVENDEHDVVQDVGGGGGGGGGGSSNGGDDETRSDDVSTSPASREDEYYENLSDDEFEDDAGSVDSVDSQESETEEASSDDEEYPLYVFRPMSRHGTDRVAELSGL